MSFANSAYVLCLRLVFMTSLESISGKIHSKELVQELEQRLLSVLLPLQQHSAGAVRCRLHSHPDPPAQLNHNMESHSPATLEESEKTGNQGLCGFFF